MGTLLSMQLFCESKTIIKLKDNYKKEKDKVRGDSTGRKYVR
jgi:hypothetical protein